MTPLTVRSGKAGQYHYYVCANRVNKGQTCTTPSMRREVLDDLVLGAVEKQVLAPQRLQALLADVLNLSDQKRVQREEELAHARAEQTRLRTAVERLLILVETGQMGPRDPIFARRTWTRTAPRSPPRRHASIPSRPSLPRGRGRSRRRSSHGSGICCPPGCATMIPRCVKLICGCWCRMSPCPAKQILISGPKAVLGNGVCNGVPRLEGMVPIFDREWCRLRDSNTRPHHYE